MGKFLFKKNNPFKNKKKSHKKSIFFDNGYFSNWEIFLILEEKNLKSSP